MRRRCPNCKSLNVRRSVRDPEDSEQPWFRSPYRCRDCQTKFWVFSAKMYRRLILLAVVNVILFATIWVVMMPLNSPGFAVESRARPAADTPP
jgi:hypothetical protein